MVVSPGRCLYTHTFIPLHSPIASLRSIRAALLLAFAIVLLTGALPSCRVTRHIPQDRSIVSRVRLEDDDPDAGGVRRTWDSRLRMAVVQKPYHRTFGFLPVSTWIWHNDTTQAFHRWRNKVGTAPVLYDEEQTRRSEAAMQRVLAQQGYLNAEVTHRTHTRRMKTSVTYRIERGRPHRLASLHIEIEDDSLRQLIMDGGVPVAARLRVGDPLDLGVLEQERTRLTQQMRNLGYWDFNKEHVRYMADTLQGEHEVDLTMLVTGRHRPYRFGRVRFVTDFDLMAPRTDTALQHDTHRRLMEAEGFELQYVGDRCYLRDKTLLENCYIRPGALYTERAITETYEALCRLHLLRYVNLRVEPRRAAADGSGSEEDAYWLYEDEADADDDRIPLDCDIYLTPRNPHTVQFEVDGTNTAGDLGFALALTYQHRNAFRGSETYTASLKGGYESLSGNLAGLVNDNYTEYSVDNTLDFPKFLFPLLSEETRRRSRATTSVRASYSFQNRPEYTRIITQGAFSYNWLSAATRHRHRWDVFNISYVYLPRQSDAFIDIVQHLGPISYSSYQSHMITSTIYSIMLGNTTLAQRQRAATAMRHVWALRLSPELAGNLMQGVARATGLRREDGRYVLFSQPYEQYARLDVDWTYNRYLTDRSRLAFHLAGGVAVPYGNSEVLPFEKRYYAGGANSVRGWSVRQLGPGRYRNVLTGALDYFNQCGDVRLDASVELRSRLFWNFEFAAFVDGGNIWTLRDYESQPGGVISSDFYRQIAAAWGVGLRLVTDFVVLRLDLGLKAYDPSQEGQAAWPLRRPLDNHNRTLHFAVGYPF